MDDLLKVILEMSARKWEVTFNCDISFKYIIITVEDGSGCPIFRRASFDDLLKHPYTVTCHLRDMRDELLVCKKA